MNVPLIWITVTRMLSATTLWEAFHVPAMKASVVMDLIAQVITKSLIV